MIEKTAKTLDFTPAVGGDSVVGQPLQTQVQDNFSNNPKETNNIVKGNEVGKPNNVVKITTEDGKTVDAVQTMGADGKPILNYNNVNYSLD